MFQYYPFIFGIVLLLCELEINHKLQDCIILNVQQKKLTMTLKIHKLSNIW